MLDRFGVQRRWVTFGINGVSVKAIASRENIMASEVSRQLSLAFLSPKIVSAILRGHQPIDLTTKRIQRTVNAPMDWNEQAQMFGFNEI